MDITTTTGCEHQDVTPRDNLQNEPSVQQAGVSLTLSLSIPEEQPRSMASQVYILTPLSSPMRRASSSDYDYAEDAEDSDDEEKDNIFALLNRFDDSQNPHTWWQERRKHELNVRSSINKTKAASLKFSPNTAFGAVKELRVKTVGRSNC